MPFPIPEPGPDERPQLAFMLEGDLPDPEPGSLAAAGLPAGLDYQALLEGLAASGALDGNEEEQDAELADRLEAARNGRMGPCDPAAIAALAVEHMEPGPAQAGWLRVAAAAADRLNENELAGVAIASRQLTSWAAASELAAVAQITSRAAAADPRIGVESGGRPARVCRDALGQIALALMLTHHGAEAWADLAVTLAWRLPDTGAALAAGRIDLYRARLIAEFTSVLSQEAARTVEKQVLPDAGGRTSGDLRARLRRAVIAADPDGAERRRRAAERSADVRLYPDHDQTATLTASSLPQIESAAGYARITALARARMAAGMPGPLSLNRAQVLLGLILGTLPLIPPADGASPDDYPPDDHDPGDGGAGPGSGGGAGHDGPGPGQDGGGQDGGGQDGGGPGQDGGGQDGGGPGQDGGGQDGGGPGQDGGGQDGGGPGQDGGDCGRPDDLPAPRDEDAPPDDGLDDLPGEEPGSGWDPADDDDDPTGAGPAPAWPALGVIPPALAPRPARPADGRPVCGPLDATLPWTTLVGLDEHPGTLGRVGPITAVQARLLAGAAETDPDAQWRVIVTNRAGQAIAVARIRRRACAARVRAARVRTARDRPPGPEPPGAGLAGRVTVTISQDTLAEHRHRSGPGPPGGIAAAVLRTAARALDKALTQAEADQAVGGCAHHAQSSAYRPPPRLREHVIARDLTCRSPVCRQPAWRSDLDHTRPWEKGGRTCSCNLGGGCRRDHQLKQDPRWKLEQARPGYFTWTTPAGRTYTVGPDEHPL